jgi:hypothetical protein
MELTKESLVTAGYTEAQATEIVAAHTKALENNYVPIHRFNEVNTELKNAKTSLTDRDKQITDLKKFEGTATELQTKVKELEDANKVKDENYKKEFSTERKRNAIKLSLLEDADGKPHDVDMVMNLFNLEQVTIDDTTGKISSGFKEQRDVLYKDKAFLFETKADPNKGGDPAKPGWKPKGNTPPDGSDGAGGGGDESVGFGKNLAAIKLGMMGKTVTDNSGSEGAHQ